MSDKKTIFIAFAIEDVRQRDLLTGQSLNVNSEFEYIDYSVKDPYLTDWKDKVRSRIRRSHGLIALISKDSLTSLGQKWEIQCANEENKPILAIWAYSNDKTVITGLSTKIWSWTTIANFINTL